LFIIISIEAIMETALTKIRVLGLHAVRPAQTRDNNAREQKMSLNSHALVHSVMLDRKPSMVNVTRTTVNIVASSICCPAVIVPDGQNHRASQSDSADLYFQILISKGS
jgi:hypothetical protein